MLSPRRHHRAPGRAAAASASARAASWNRIATRRQSASPS
jgi:hypothetical protein